MDAILILVGIKMLLIDIWKVPITWSPAAIAACLVVAVAASLHATRPSKTRERQKIP